MGEGGDSPAWGEVMGELARRWKVLKAKKKERSRGAASAVSPNSESESFAGSNVAVVAEDLGSMILGPAA